MPGSTPVDITAVRSQVNAELCERFDDGHEHERALARTQMVFDLFYDDEADGPGLAVGDALTDLMHIASERGVDFEQTLSRALRRWGDEREEWGLDS